MYYVLGTVHWGLTQFVFTVTLGGRVIIVPKASLRHREVRLLLEGYAASMWQSRDSNLEVGYRMPGASLSTLLLPPS